MRKMISLISISVVILIFISGCSTFIESTIDKAAGAAGNKVGQRIGDTVGTAVAGYAEASLMNLTPALMQMYVSSIFSMVYYHGGYSFSYNEYEPGDLTRWKATGMDEGDEFEKAFLKREEDGKEWWRVVSKGMREGNMEEVVLESLFSPPDEAGYRRLLRLRSLFPGDKEAAEVPVQENTAAWYAQPTKLTKESLEAATKGFEDVTTPAGSFNTRHVVYRDIRGIAEWWLTDEVPGGLVKYKVTYTSEESEEEEETESAEYIVEVTSFDRKGGAMDSRLGSF
ncbi:hypothetical protein GF312_21365 [Candidatus Poribacteria bacterium]|nr:hypothetical protein [Candidatus Poribacteria bacterium]